MEKQRIGLLGNPNVGKSLIFTHLTGIGVEVSNYPGTTVHLKHGLCCSQDCPFVLVDLPGLYALNGSTPEEQFIREMIMRHELDSLIVVLDARHLERNLYLLLQACEYDIPLIIVVNMMDYAKEHGLELDLNQMQEMFCVPVIGTSAIHGTNISEIVPAISAAAHPRWNTQYDAHIEAACRSLNRLSQISKKEALHLLEGIEPWPHTTLKSKEELQETAKIITAEVEQEHQMSIQQIIAANRHYAASRIAKKVVSHTPSKQKLDLDYLLTRGFPGIPILLLLLGLMLSIVFMLGSALEEVVVELFTTYILDPLGLLSLSPLAYEVLYALAMAVMAGLGIAFPFIFIFYLLISALEDSGYMTRAAFLADRVMHQFGLHGQVLVPMILGLGCNVPAIMGIRQLNTRRERFIASFLITMVPCSARTVIIAGIVSTYLGLWWAFSIYLVVGVLLIITGIMLSKVTPGTEYGMVLEMAPLRLPGPKQVLIRSMIHIREFLFVAMPLLLVSSVVLGLLGYFGVLSWFEAVMAPFMTGVLGLPGFASTALLFGILRKEMALETLIVLAGSADLSTLMNGIQLYTFSIVSVLFVPCVSTIAVLARELGTRHAILVSLYTVLLGIVVGSLVHLIMSM
ncbi:MAG: ferrous iron transport protein B [Methanomicrobiales archaeon]|jgi:ferrous iron transport protein B|nr:ferrous iron transport protein B [Methanomicrobiales archaeon]